MFASPQPRHSDLFSGYCDSVRERSSIWVRVSSVPLNAFILTRHLESVSQIQRKLTEWNTCACALHYTHSQWMSCSEQRYAERMASLYICKQNGFSYPLDVYRFGWVKRFQLVVKLLAKDVTSFKCMCQLIVNFVRLSFLKHKKLWKKNLHLGFKLKKRLKFVWSGKDQNFWRFQLVIKENYKKLKVK